MSRCAPHEEPYVLHTLAISLPGRPVRVLIDGVSPDADARTLAQEYVFALAKAPVSTWRVQMVASTEYQDLLPAPGSPT